MLEQEVETEGQEQSQESETEVEEEEPTVDELQDQVKELTDIVRQLVEPEEEVEEEDRPNPQLIEYAEDLKDRLGEFYDEKLDKIKLDERIGIMKYSLKMLDKKDSIKQEGQPPKASKKKHRNVRGIDYRKL